MQRAEIGLLRLVAQRIAAPVGTPVEAVRWLTAVQAQDPKGAALSVALRTAGRDLAQVTQAYDEGAVVKSWPMRGTLHLVAAEDLPWMLELLTPRVVAGAARRRAALGIDEDDLRHVGEVTTRALAGGRSLSRDELMQSWNAHGIATAAQRGYHLLAHLAQTGVVCFGPTRDDEQQLVLVDEWIRSPRRPEREEALGELALRFFRSHGPASDKDLVRWTGLRAGDVRAGLALARPELESVDVDGVEHLMDPRTPELLAAARSAARGVHLLPGFDEIVLGYGDRSAVLPPEFADRIVPGGNGVFRPTVVAAGQVVGTWRSAGPRGRPRLEVDAFQPLPARVQVAAERAYAALP